MSSRNFYKLLTATVVPRPIAWVSTISGDDVANLAPHSFFTVSCVDPPMVQFTSVGTKDTLTNVRSTAEFVVCAATEPMFERINATATDFPPDIGEFEAAGLTPEPSRTVSPPRVAESPAAFECTLERDIELGDSTVVIGRVRELVLDEDLLVRDERDNLLPDAGKLAPLARLGRDEWATLGEILRIPRISYADWPGHFDRG
ncbi:flavin reductase family protein [Saccharopolyspora montiporae]|nr:flavin reductase family protein [Saccharopolyspora sp. HNM0983]